MPIYNNILQLVGRTPVVRINRLAPAGINMFVKCEFFNPAASVKDRLALAVIEVRMFHASTLAPEFADSQLAGRRKERKVTAGTNCCGSNKRKYRGGTCHGLRS